VLEAVRLISELLASPGVKVLPAPAQAVAGLLELLRRSAVTGDFEIFPELTVTVPG